MMKKNKKKERTIKKSNTTAFVLTLIAAIWAMFGGATIIIGRIIGPYTMGDILTEFPVQMVDLFLMLSLIFGIFNLVFGLAMLIGSIKIKNNKRSGAIITLVTSIIFLLAFQLVQGVFGLIGAILAFRKK